MLKVVISMGESNLCIERGEAAGSIKLTAYNVENENDVSVTINQDDLNKSIDFVLGNTPVPEPTPVTGTLS